VNRRFQAKQMKYSNFLCYKNNCVDFDIILQNGKDLRVLVDIPKCAPQVQDGGRERL